MSERRHDWRLPRCCDIRMSCMDFLKAGSLPVVPKEPAFATVNTSEKPWKITAGKPKDEE